MSHEPEPNHPDGLPDERSEGAADEELLASLARVPGVLVATVDSPRAGRMSAEAQAAACLSTKAYSAIWRHLGEESAPEA